MKNIFFYIYPEHAFAKDYVLMSEVQIDNSLEFWDPKNIIVVTNFPWKYRGVKAHVVGDELNAQVQSHGTSLSNKPIVIKYLIEKNLVDDINWFHDWDIFQLAPLELPAINRDIGLVEYGYKPQINLGSIFFKPSSLDIFTWIADGITRHKLNEEETTNKLIAENFNNIQGRFQLLNGTYNIEMRDIDQAIKKADKPLRIAHFPPYKASYLHKSRKVTPPHLRKLLDEKFNSQTNSVKNLLIYISPDKKFTPEHAKMIEVQIDNSLAYWDREDIVLLTNFPYEYKGIKAIVAPDTLINQSYYTNSRGIINSKVNAIIYLIEQKIITGLTWFHDLDCFQLAPLDLPEITADLGVTCYGIYPENRLTNLGKPYKNRVNFGSVFFKPESLDIFKHLLHRMDKDGLYEEDAMTIMLDKNSHTIAPRVQIMNQTYNIGMRCVRSNIQNAIKPIKVVHFPPHDPHKLNKFKPLLTNNLAGLLDQRFTKPITVDSSKAIRYLQELKFYRGNRLWEKFMRRYNCQRVVELGVRAGQNFKRMIAHRPELAVAVDAWVDDGVASRNDGRYDQQTLNKMYQRFKQQMADRKGIQIYREYTVEAAKHFSDEYFDFIYIDADHSYDGCFSDLVAWYPKIKINGFLVGDDYDDFRPPVPGVTFGVVKAVNDFARLKNLKVYELPKAGWAMIK